MSSAQKVLNRFLDKYFDFVSFDLERQNLGSSDGWWATITIQPLAYYEEFTMCGATPDKAIRNVLKYFRKNVVEAHKSYLEYGNAGAVSEHYKKTENLCRKCRRKVR